MPSVEKNRLDRIQMNRPSNQLMFVWNLQGEKFNTNNFFEDCKRRFESMANIRLILIQIKLEFRENHLFSPNGIVSRLMFKGNRIFQFIDQSNSITDSVSRQY